MQIFWNLDIWTKPELLCASCIYGHVLKDGKCVKDDNPVSSNSSSSGNPESSSSGANYMVVVSILSFILLFI